MKTHIKFLRNLILVGVVTFGFASAAQAKDEYISFEALPGQAQGFIKEHFSKAKVISVKRDKSWFSSDTYDVTLNDNTEIEFSDTGEWLEVDMGSRKSLPEGILPSPMKDYLKENFSGVGVKEIQKKNYGYKIELMNDMDLRFNKEGQFTRLD